MAINDTFRFWFDLPGKGLTQVFPYNSQLKWTDKRKSGYPRLIQRTLETPLILMDEPKTNNYGFSYLMDLERQGLTCEKVDVFIDRYCDCNEEWISDWYKGYLRLNAGEWDVSNCTVTIPVVVQDPFTCLTTTWTNDVDMFEYGDPPITVNPIIGVVQFMECGPQEYLRTFPAGTQMAVVNQAITDDFYANYQYECLTDPPDTPFSDGSWVPVIHTHKTIVIIQQESNTIRTHQWIKTRWAREYVAGAVMPPGLGWVAVNLGLGWARPVPLSLPPSNLDDTTPEGVEALEAVWPEQFMEWGRIVRWNMVGLDEFGNSTLTNGKELGPLLIDLLEPCGLTVISNFYNINPDATNPDNDYYTRAQTDFHRIVLFQVTDLARLDETQSATIALIKVKEMIDAMKVAGNCDISIEGTTLRIEHVSYWPDEVQMDLTLPEFYHLIEEKWKYTYDQEAQPKNEIIAWNEETDGKGGDFDGYPIEYDNACVNDQDDSKVDKTYTAKNYLSNILKIYGNEDFYDDTETIVMVSTTDLVANSAVQPISGLDKLNGNLAMGYLLPRYYDYGRPFIEGYINKTLTPLYSALRLKLQAPITIPFQCDDYLNNYDPQKLIKTQLAGCQIDSATYVDPDETLEVKLRGK